MTPGEKGSGWRVKVQGPQGVGNINKFNSLNCALGVVVVLVVH